MMTSFERSSAPARGRKLVRHLAPWPTAIAAAAMVVACGGGSDNGSGFFPFSFGGGSTPAGSGASTTSGVVTGSYYRNAKVCIDANNNGRCDSGETSTTTDANGAFTLSGQGAVVAEIGTSSKRFDPKTGAMKMFLYTEKDGIKQHHVLKEVNDGETPNRDAGNAISQRQGSVVSVVRSKEFAGFRWGSASAPESVRRT